MGGLSHSYPHHPSDPTLKILANPPICPFSLLRNNEFGASASAKKYGVFSAVTTSRILYVIFGRFLATNYDLFSFDRRIITCAMLGITFSLMPPCIMVMAVVVRCSASVSGSPTGQNRWLNDPHSNCPGFEFIPARTADTALESSHRLERII
jgi:hypothetical protein